MRFLWATIFSLSCVAAAASCSATGDKGNGGSHAGTGGATTGGGSTGGTTTTSTDGGLVLEGGDDACKTKVTCADVGADCGMILDGCGGVLDCGSTCPAGKTCGGAGTPNVCSAPPCMAKTCADQGIACGPAGDGCGKPLDCGGCTAPDTCGGGGTPSVCGHSVICVPKTCAQLGFNCGPAGDGCGGSLNCGACTGTDTCGGGGTSGVCGHAPCVPKTCAQVGAGCGFVADGCGNAIDCGTCTPPETCGGGGTPNVCAAPTNCTGLCLSQVMCPTPGVTTTISGTVYAPNGIDPLPNALVYVPNGVVQPFTPGVSCDICGAAASGSPLVTAVSDVQGKFTLKNAPAAANVPLVIQLGRWRRQTVIGTVNACVDNPMPPSQTRLPRKKSEGDIPLIAVATGSLDSLECIFRQIGVDDSEFTAGTGNGRIHIYTGSGSAGATITGAQNETTLTTTAATLNKYDMVFFPCQGSPYTKTAAQLTNMLSYAAAGGRVFTTHYSYVWLYQNGPFAGTASWYPDNYLFNEDQTGYIDTSFPKGQLLAEWLQYVGASTTLGQIPLNQLRQDSTGVVPPTQTWMTIDDPDQGVVPAHFTFNAPVGALPSQQCGRVLFDDFHVFDSSFGTFPGECTGGALTPQQKLLEFMIFDLASCVTPDVPNCTPQTCAQLGATCGQAGDGCGGALSCGTCPAGQTCSGTPSTCHPPMCTPKTCAQLSINCGPAGNGCGGLIQCGSCPPGQTCGGGGQPGVCGSQPCTPKTCVQLGFNCGPAGDGCGGLLDCGTCPPTQSCGGGGQPGVCGQPLCTPKTCTQLGAECGKIADSCGGLLDCGACQLPKTCGGGGIPNKCGGGV